MHIILVSNRLATAKTFSVPLRVALAVVVALAGLVLAAAFLLTRPSSPSDASGASAPVIAGNPPASPHEAHVDVRDNINSMAVKLGEMQAELMRLDSLGDRISKLTGLPTPKNEQAEKTGKNEKDPKAGKDANDGRGGPLILTSRPLAADELQREIDRLAEAVEESADNLTALESQLMERRIKSILLPTLVPIDAKRIGSVFGRRIDPIAGVRALHEGIDFGADIGTPIIAAAGGVVSLANFHPEYGHLIEIDHGNEFSSRYAHLSKIKVRPGQIVKRSQLIALSGNSGRSTGPHLHFEVRFKGIAQNPDRFLNQGASLAQAPGASATLKPATLPRNAERGPSSRRKAAEKPPQ